MPQALWIFRKDLRRFRGLLAVVVPLEVLAGWAASSPSAAQGQLFIRLLLTLAQWFLIVSLIHEEAVPGGRQYWLTRPIAWKHLLLAKAAFILLFIHLPCFLTDAATLAAHGQSVVHFLPSLLACQFFLLAKVVLPAAAIAAVTASLAQFVWHCLALFIGFYLVLFSLAMCSPFGMDWGGVEWFRSTVVAVLAIAVAVGILVVQYARRNTRASRGILAAAIPILACSFWMPGWHAAFALQARMGPHGADASAIRLSFDPARDPNTQPHGAVSWGGPWHWRQTTGIYVPVRVTGIPAGMELYSDRATVTLTMSDGRMWTSGWDSLHKLHRAANGRPAKFGEEYFLTAGDEGWQYLNIDSSLYSTGRKPVRMHITSAMTLFSQPEVTAMARGGRVRSVPGGGSCWKNGTLPVWCVWPGQVPQVNFVRIRSIATGVFTDFSLSPTIGSSPGTSYGPYPDGGSIWQMASSPMYNTLPQPPTEISLVSRRAVAHFERDLDIPIEDSVPWRFVP